jgi:hypothetical protein
VLGTHHENVIMHPDHILQVTLEIEIGQINSCISLGSVLQMYYKCNTFVIQKDQKTPLDEGIL